MAEPPRKRARAAEAPDSLETSPAPTVEEVQARLLEELRSQEPDLPALVNFVGAVARKAFPTQERDLKSDPAATKTLRKQTLRRLKRVVAPFVLSGTQQDQRQVVDAGASDAFSFDVARATQELGPDVCTALRRMWGRVDDLKKTSDEACLAFLLQGGSVDCFEDEYGWVTNKLRRQRVLAAAAKLFTPHTPPPVYSPRIDALSILNHPLFGNLQKQWRGELLPFVKLFYKPESLVLRAHLEVVKPKLDPLRAQVPGLEGSIERLFRQDLPVYGRGAGMNEAVVADLLKAARTESMTEPSTPREAYVTLASLRRFHIREELKPEVVAWVVAERQVKRVSAQEQALDYGCLLNLALSASDDPLASIFARMKLEDKPATELYEKLSATLLRAIEPLLGRLLGDDAEEVDEMLLKFCTDALAFSQDDNTGLFDEKEAADTWQVTDTASFRVYSGQVVRSDAASAALRQVIEQLSEPQKAPLVPDIAPIAHNLTQTIRSIADLTRQELELVLSDSNGLHRVRCALLLAFARVPESPSFGLRDGIGAWTRAMATLAAHGDVLPRQIILQLARLTLAAFIMALLLPTAGIAGTVLDASLFRLVQHTVMRKEELIVVGEWHKHVVGGVFSMESYSTRDLMSVTTICKDIGRVDPRHYQFASKLQESMCWFDHVCGRPLVYDPHQRHGDNDNGQRISVCVFLRRKPLDLGNGLSLRCAFDCIIRSFHCSFVPGLALSALRLYALAHFNDKASRGKDSVFRLGTLFCDASMEDAVCPDEEADAE